jgi:ubiquinone/menaquinone biosynthesis C-methylase UbiE
LKGGKKSSHLDCNVADRVCRFIASIGGIREIAVGDRGMDHFSRVKEEFKRQAETLSAAPVFTDLEVLEKIHDAIRPTKMMNLLDLGCGPGIVTSALAPHVREVVAYDLTSEMLDKARQRCEKEGLKNIRFKLGSAEQLPFEKESFDCVVTRLTIHHFLDPRQVMNEVVRVIRKYGKVVVADVVSSENEEEADLHNALETLRDPSHVRMLSAPELQELLKASGLRITSKMTWEMKRDYDEWIRITNAPERVKPLYTVMVTLAKAGIQAGINLHLDGNTVVFNHNYLLVAAEKYIG